MHLQLNMYAYFFTYLYKALGLTDLARRLALTHLSLTIAAH
jgi:hypothetical protein